MDYTNAETLGDNSMTEIESCNFAVDNGGLYDPSDDLAELHWLASFLDEPLLEKAPKPLFSPSFGAKTKDIHGEEQSSDKLKSSISISILERSSCSGNISTFSPEMAAPEKERNGMAGFSDRSSPHANSNMVLENCPKPFPAANAAVSSDSDHLISEQAKSHPSNKVSKANQGTETKWEDVTKVMKCINCDTRKNAQWIAGPMGPKVLCIACGERYRTGRHLHHFVSELEKSHASNKIYKTNEGIKRKGQGTVQVKKCMHCGIQRTPQWRAGPMGPKTLCNACGVRYRSGRLLPEYRPAASPTFSVDKHSNFHKALLERRGQKETAAKQSSEAKQMYSGSEEQALYVEASQKVLKNCPNSSLFANASVCSDSDYFKFISKQPKSDTLKKFPKSNQAIIRKGQDATKVSKCMQCSKHKTPQWRDGPMSPKTLCNDCGVSYRPGKLMPDYRLDASPTFSDDEHSNSHRKVLERRDQKEFATQASQEKQTYFSSEVQASCVETPQDGLESCPNSFLSVNASVCNGLDYFVSEQASLGPLKKIQKKNQGIIRKGQNTMKVRKCMHCSIKKTPQWRDGPMGPKTLCNACGVRYRSGRLLPEYRPAASPTFSVDKHSNSHKKVLEMRVQKEFGAQQPT